MLQYIIGFIWLYIIRPVFSGIFSFLDWCSRNLWFFVSIVLCWFIYMERRGLEEDALSEPARTLLTTPIVFDMTVIHIMLFITLFVVVVYIYKTLRSIILSLYQTMKGWISAIILIVLYIYFKIFRIENNEFIVMEGMINWKDILIVCGIFISILSLFGYVAFMQQIIESDLQTKFITDTIDFGDSNITLSDGNINITGWQEKPLKKKSIMRFNLTTEKYGYNVFNVSGMVDNAATRFEGVLKYLIDTRYSL